MATASIKKTKPIDYPTSDGKPMAETDFHRDLMYALIHRLEYHYEDAPNVYVSGNLLFFYEKDNRRRHVAPDVFVVKGVGKQKRDYYLAWEEGRMPNCIIEVTSKTTKREDQTKKRALYRDTLKVSESFMFDPFGEYLKPRLQGFRLVNGDFEPIPLVDGRMESKELGLFLVPDGQDLRLYDPVNDEWIPTPEFRADEAEGRADEAEGRADEAEGRADEAERRAAQAEDLARRERLRAEQAEREKIAMADELERLRTEFAKSKAGE